MELEESIEHLQPKNNENAIKDRYQASHGGNIVTRKMEFDRGIPLSFDFVSNEIYTIKHKIHSQFLLVVSKFFKRPVQVLLIVLNILYLIAYLVIDKPVSNLQIYFVFIPQIALLILEIILELIEYFKIIYNDNKTNNQAAHIYDNDLKSFVSTSWKNIRVGQIIKVNKDEIVPADIIILETLDSNHLCYIDESSITGVFDAFKIKRACIDTLTPVMKPIKINEYLKNMKGMFKYEEPNAELKYFSGRLKLESFPRASDVNIENFVMRGSSVKNIKCVYGLVVYAGMETKIMQIIQSEKKSEIIKKGRNLITYSFVEIQFLIIFVYICLVADYAISLLGKNYYGINNKSTIKYLEITDWWEEYVVSLLQFSFSIQLFIPYIWFNLIYIAYYILETLIIWDAKVRRKPKYTVDIIHNDCLADFGQVKYILSDKTGTLTKRKFIVKACFVDDKYLSLDPLDKVDENFIFKEDDIQWVKKLPIYRELEIEKRELASTNKEGPISAFLEGLCICHSVKLRKKDSIFVNNDKVFGASFAEEKAIFKVLKNLDFSLNKTKNDKIILEIGGDTKIYYIVGRNRYSEERQRMSIIVKKRKTDNDSILYCKGNDASILHNINFKNDEDKQNLLDQIKRMANLGFRFFIFAKKFLFEDDTNTFITKYKSAENNMIQREVFFENLANEYETDLDFMGILFFEEEFTTELRQSIMKLDNAGIRTWIISGDKRDNVVSVAKNLEMVSHNSNIVEFAREDDLDDLDIKMNLHLMQFIGGNNDKYNKDKIENDANIDGASSNNNMLKISRNETSVAKKTLNKELFMFIDGDCFNLICNDTRLFQSFTILLSYTKGFFGYSFSPNNKYRFTKIMQDYVTHNSKLLAIGDGLNDLMMLKEADLSIGIRSREILQVRNTCDIIVSTFPQITDILLVHGTWNLHRLTTICMFSFYACTLIAFPYILNYRLLSFGAVFPSINYLILMLQLITINISLIIILCFDQNIERPIIGIAPKVYTQNYMNKYDKYKKFIYEFLKGIIDSLIIYYGINYSLKFPINSIGQVSDKLLIDTTIAFASFMVVYLKLIFCYMNIINILSVSIAVISYAGLIGFNFIYLDEHIITIEAFGFLNIIFAFICVVFSSFLLEVIFMNLKLFMFVNLVTYLSNEFKHRINGKLLFFIYAFLLKLHLLFLSYFHLQN